jgi:hypothetical protein
MGDRDITVGTRRAQAIPLAAIGGALSFGALLVRDWRKPKCGAVIYAPPLSAWREGAGPLRPLRSETIRISSIMSVQRGGPRTEDQALGRRGPAYPGASKDRPLRVGKRRIPAALACRSVTPPGSPNPPAPWPGSGPSSSSTWSRPSAPTESRSGCSRRRTRSSTRRSRVCRHDHRHRARAPIRVSTRSRTPRPPPQRPHPQAVERFGGRPQPIVSVHSFIAVTAQVDLGKDYQLEIR